MFVTRLTHSSFLSRSFLTVVSRIIWYCDTKTVRRDKLYNPRAGIASTNVGISPGTESSIIQKLDCLLPTRTLMEFFYQTYLHFIPLFCAFWLSIWASSSNSWRQNNFSLALLCDLLEKRNCSILERLPTQQLNNSLRGGERTKTVSPKSAVIDTTSWHSRYTS